MTRHQRMRLHHTPTSAHLGVLDVEWVPLWFTLQTMLCEMLNDGKPCLRECTRFNNLASTHLSLIHNTSMFLRFVGGVG